MRKLGSNGSRHLLPCLGGGMIRIVQGLLDCTRVYFLSSACLLILMFVLGCSRQDYLMTSDEMRLAYDYHPVKNGRGTVLLLHGLASTHAEWKSLENFLTGNGWSVMTLDFRGHGGSRRWRNKDLDWEDFTYDGIMSFTLDIDAAVQFLKGRDNGPVWIVGSSIGANLGLNYAVADPTIQGIILLSPGINYRGVESLPAAEQWDSRPVLIVASDNDIGAVDAAEQLHGILKVPKKFLKYSQAGHGAEMVDRDKTLKYEILQWLNRDPNEPVNL